MENTEAINHYLAIIAQHGNPAMDMGHWSDFVNRVQAVCADNAKLREALKTCQDEHAHQAEMWDSISELENRDYHQKWANFCTEKLKA